MAACLSGTTWRRIGRKDSSAWPGRSPMALARVACLVAAFALAGCAHRYSPPEMHPPDAVFPGLWDALAEHGEADFLYVHGMCVHTVEDARLVFQRVANPLGLDVEVDSKGEPIGQHGGTLHRGTMRGQGRTVNVFAIVWSPISATPNQALCFDV